MTEKDELKGKVKGLMGDIDEIIKDIDYDYRRGICDEVTKNNLVGILLAVKNLIKNWFPGVVSEDEEKNICNNRS